MGTARLTGYTGEQLSRKLLYVSARKWDKLVALEEIKDALTEQVGDDTNVVPEIKSVAEMDALVAVLLVVLGERR